MKKLLNEAPRSIVRITCAIWLFYWIAMFSLACAAYVPDINEFAKVHPNYFAALYPISLFSFAIIAVLPIWRAGVPFFKD